MEYGRREIPVKRRGPSTIEEALTGVLPRHLLHLLPRAYDAVGNIAILEIPRELYEYRFEIGRAFHSLHPNFSTVLCKRGAISGITRTRDYELLSGVRKTKTVHTEYGCRIAVDLAVAYFSPRLLEEHHRVAAQVEDGESVLDMFTGVGPFALHIARNHQATVTAIDINPHAIALLRESLEMNRLRGTVIPVVADAHQYVPANFDHNVDRVIMNHPSGASQFIAEVCLAVRGGGIIHYYDFVPSADAKNRLREKVLHLINNAGYEVAKICTVQRVRDSAPYEVQMVADIMIG